MPQKYGKFVLEDADLSLALDSKKEISKTFFNVSVQNGIVSKHTIKGFADIVEPNRQTALDQIIENIGGLQSVYEYKTQTGGVQRDFLLLFSTENLLYYYELNSLSPELVCFDSISLACVPHYETFTFDDKNLLIISTEEDQMWVWDGVNNPYEVLDSPKIVSSAIGLGRLFVCSHDKPYSVFYSEDLDPSTWSMSSGDVAEINFADNLGKVTKLVAIDNYIFAIRERGIVKIYSKANGEFSVSRILSFFGNIFSDSICETKDGIIFCADMSLYKFDGLNIKKLCTFENSFKQFEKVSAVSVNDEYYLFVTDETSTTRVLMLCSSQEKVSEIIKIESFESVFFVQVNACCFVGFVGRKDLSKNAKLPYIISKSSEILPFEQEFLFQTRKLYFAPKHEKATIVFFDIVSKTDIEVCISNGINSKTFEIFASDFVQRHNVLLSGYYFEFSILGEHGANIDSMVLNYSFVSEK